MSANLAKKYLREQGETVDDWDGLCGELADAVIGPGDDILFVEGDIAWRFHMVPFIGGLVHDAWCKGGALRPAQWLSSMFGDSEIELSLNGDTVYSGPADRLPKNALDGIPLPT